MSSHGMRKTFGALRDMQALRIELLSGDAQDIRLGQLIGRGHDVIAKRATEISLEPDDAVRQSRRGTG